MDPRFIDWIWHIRGSLPLAPEQSSEEAFGRLDSLFRQTGTNHDRTRDTLTFRKKDQAAQDKMSVFDGGVLQIEKVGVAPVLHYHLTSRALLFCFLAPILFLGFAQLTVALGKLDKRSTEVAEKSGKSSESSKKLGKKHVVLPQNPIDKALGSPAPEKKEEGADKSEKEKKKHSPKAAYIFAGIFAALYIVGRILEGRLIKGLFRKHLLGS